MEDGHFIDDPLVVVSIKPDFSGLGLSKKVGDKDIDKIQAAREEATVWPLSEREKEIIKGLK